MRVSTTRNRAARAGAIHAASLGAMALALAATSAQAQDAAAAPAEEGEAIVVTGIRASLTQALNIKRSAQGVVDAISAEDIGKFPDTNLRSEERRVGKECRL